VKVFGIGLSKTGTTSLARGLDLLGYTVKDCLGLSKYKKNDLDSISRSALDSYDAFTDTPIPSFYRELDEAYPGSKFILTVRDIDDWLTSCKKQFTPKLAEKRSDAVNRMFLDLYGTVVFDEARFRDAYTRFVNGVMDHFKDRPDDLLVIDIAAGEGWEKLCPFLNRPVEAGLFPKSNVTAIKWLDAKGIAQSIRFVTKRLSRVEGYRGYVDLKSIVYRVFRRDNVERQKAQGKKLEELLIDELSKQASGVPVISKNHHKYTSQERSHWHHFWLIDCPDVIVSSERIGKQHIINAALIEDGAPFIGIVYSPYYDTLYYGTIGKGAFKSIGNQAFTPIRGSKSEQGNEKTGAIVNNIGWQLCRLAERGEPVSVRLEETKEWDTGAGHAILRSIGYGLANSRDQRPLNYNKDFWENPPLEVTECVGIA
jgi:3'-phosphoadenosine 5'-phosphosulfate (PAPS) 3'-phosphatase